MRTKDKILVEISKIKHSVELGCSTNEAAYRVGMVDGMHYALGDDETDQQEDDVVTLNVKYEPHKETNEDILRLVDLLELQIKICDCSVGIKYDMLDKIDNIHSAIHNTECESANTKDEDIKVNVKYELDKKAYRQYVADMNQIESEFKADNVFVGVAGEKLEGGDAVYQNTDGKMYRSDCIPANLKDACNRCIEAYSDDDMYHRLIRTHVISILEGTHTDSISCVSHDDDDTTKHIPATLKDVCEWWISKYKRNSTFDEHTIESSTAENMEYLMKKRGW